MATTPSTQEMLELVTSKSVAATAQQTARVFTWENVRRPGVDVVIHRLDLTLTPGALSFVAKVSSSDSGDEVRVGFVLSLSDGSKAVLPDLCYGILCPHYYEFDIHDKDKEKDWTFSQQNANVPADVLRIQTAGMYWDG